MGELVGNCSLWQEIDYFEAALTFKWQPLPRPGGSRHFAHFDEVPYSDITFHQGIIVQANITCFPWKEVDENGIKKSRR